MHVLGADPIVVTQTTVQFEDPVEVSAPHRVELHEVTDISLMQGNVSSQSTVRTLMCNVGVAAVRGQQPAHAWC